MFLIVFGVSGAGKTVVGRLLAQQLGYKFYDADYFHPPENVEKMRRGVPLTDEERWPWLDGLRALVMQSIDRRENAVLACSALKERYRRHLRADESVKLVYLRGDRELIAERLRQRRGHFMNPGLLESQFADLEEPEPRERAVTVDVTGTLGEVVAKIRAKLASS